VSSEHPRSHRSIHVRFPNAPKGTCRYCGVECDPDSTAHDYCRDQQRRARSYRADAIKRSGGVCVDANRGLGPCKGPIEAHHVQELIDNGPKDWAIAVCREHHRQRTREAAARRREQTQKVRPVKKKTPAPSRASSRAKTTTGKAKSTLSSLTQRLVGFAILAGALWWMSGGTDDIARNAPGAPSWVGPLGETVRAVLTFVLVLACAAAALFALALAARAVLRLRAAERTRIEQLLAYEMKTDPALIAVRVKKWQGVRAPRALEGRVTYGQAFNDDVLSPERARVETLIARKVVGDGYPQVVCRWVEDRDTMTWRAAKEPLRTPTPDADVTEPDDAHAARVQRQCAKLAEALAEAMGVKDKALVAVEVVGRPDALAPTALRVTYPAKFRDENDNERAKVLDIVHAKMPSSIRWKGTWDTENNTLDLERRPKIAESIPAKVPAKSELDPRRIPLGMAEHGEPLVWDRRTAPHLLIAGETGSGKTVLLNLILVSWLLRGWETYIIDGKGTALAGFRGFAGVRAIALGEGPDMHDVMLAAEEMMRDRYRKVRDGLVEGHELRPVLVVLDEAAEFQKLVTIWWKMEGRESKQQPTDPPSVEAWQSIARLGRECQVHLVLGVQQPSAKLLGGGTEARDNFGLRVSTGPTTEQSARMLFGDASIGRDVPSSIKGRATVNGKSGTPVEVQLFDAGELHPTGKPKPGPRGEPIKPWLEALGRPDVETMLQRRIEAKAAAQSEDTPPPTPAPVAELPASPPAAQQTIVGSVEEPAAGDWEPVPVTSEGLDGGTVKVEVEDGAFIGKVLGRIEEGNTVELDIEAADGSGAELFGYGRDESVLLWVGEGEPTA